MVLCKATRSRGGNQCFCSNIGIFSRRSSLRTTHVCQRRNPKTTRRWHMAASGELGDVESNEFGSIVPLRKVLAQEEEDYLKKNPLYEIVSSVPPPELVARFNKNASPEVQAAFQATLMDMVGSLPGAMFPTRLRTVTSNIVQLMQTSIMTGYLFRNAQYRLSMLKSVGTALLEEADLPQEVDVIGSSVLNDKEEEISRDEITPQEFVDNLREEVQTLKSEISRYRRMEQATNGSFSNELIGYIKSFDSSSLELMTKDAGPEVMDAMRKLVDGVLGRGKDPSSPVETTLNELGSLLLYNMVSGYFLREAEVRLNLDREF